VAGNRAGWFPASRLAIGDEDKIMQSATSTPTPARDLFCMIVHDLKSPLAQITANLDLLEMGELDEEQRQFLEGARIGAADMALMISNILDLHRMETQRAQLAFGAVDPVELAEAVAQRLSAHAALKKIRLVCTAAPATPPLVLDRQVMERVLRNLLMNAIEHSPAGGCVRVGLAYDAARWQLTLTVDDEGRGIPPEQRERIFQPFCQGEDPAARGAGAGIGLAFCRMAVEAHHGSIAAEAGPYGTGTRMHLTLPLLTLKGEPIS